MVPARKVEPSGRHHQKPTVRFESRNEAPKVSIDTTPKPQVSATGSLSSLYLDKIEISAAEEERRRTGRYLAVCLTLVMLFIACYHILMRQMPVLVGLLAPAIIMILYVIWLLYFAKKRRRAEVTLV